MLLRLLSLCSAFFLVTVATLPATFGVSVDTSLIDAIDEQDRAERDAVLQDMQEHMTFRSFASCEEMSRVLSDFLEEHREFFRGYGYFGRGGGVTPDMPMPVPTDGLMVDGDTPSGSLDRVAGEAVSEDMSVGMGGSAAYSTTNVQVAGIDEPDILKTDGTYMYYYNQRLQGVFVMRVDRLTGEPTILTKIALPKDFHNIQLFLEGDTLAILTQRWRNVYYPTLLDSSSKVHVVLYNVSAPHSPQLVKLTDYPGYISDARLVNGQLYIINQLSLHMGWLATHAEQDERLALSHRDIAPQQIDVSYVADPHQQNLRIDGTLLPYRVSQVRMPCDRVQYVLPTKDALERMGASPSFTTVYTLDIRDAGKVAGSSAVFGHMASLYMSSDRLYMTQRIYTPGGFMCPGMMRCLLPRFGGGEHTIVHALQHNNTRGLQYVYSSVVEGAPLHQWSMDENQDGYLRILTSNRRPEASTNLTILDNTGEIAGSLRNIEPGEEFKASRYIGDKLYLVTFEAIDPLFVIDVADSRTPQILGELKIPGYSTYLHPYTPLADGIQYLIGIGYDTTEASWGGVVNAGIKIDLYKVDYNVVTNGQVAMSQEASLTLGDQGSFTESQYNPRVFVWNENTRELTLPMVLTEVQDNEFCNVRYNSLGEEVGRSCYTQQQFIPTFAGLKRFVIDPVRGIEERLSRDYLYQFAQLAMSSQGDIQPWFFHGWQARAGYIGEMTYLLTNYFIDIIDREDRSVQRFFEDANRLMPPQCTYTPPGPDEVVCDMYCGERWVRSDSDNGCALVHVPAACSCPGYDTQALCEEMCAE